MGVKGVANEITVKPKMAPADVKDKTETALKRNATLDANQIKVQADGGKDAERQRPLLGGAGGGGGCRLVRARGQ